MTIRFQPVGSAPQLRQRVFKVSSKNRFETVVGFLGRKLAAAGGAAAAGEGGGVGGGKGEGGGGSGGQQKQQVFCYVNSVFAPGLDEGVGGLWRVSIFLGFGGFHLVVNRTGLSECKEVMADDGWCVCSASRRMISLRLRIR